MSAIHDPSNRNEVVKSEMTAFVRVYVRLLPIYSLFSWKVFHRSGQRFWTAFWAALNDLKISKRVISENSCLENFRVFALVFY